MPASARRRVQGATTSGRRRRNAGPIFDGRSPGIQGIGLIALAAAPTLVTATAVSAAGRAATHALARPARENLFTAVGREDRFKTKNVVDTLVYRFGDFGSSWLHRGLALAGIALTAVALPLAAAWAVLALALGVGHRRRVR